MPDTIPSPQYEQETLMGVPREKLAEVTGKIGEWTGFISLDGEDLSEIFNELAEPRERGNEVENDPSFKQIIPYFVIKRGDSVLVSSRKTGAGEPKLHGEGLIGFGGHLNPSDMKGKKMSEWLKVEFEEEIVLSDGSEILDITFKGIVNDDSDANSGVGRMHVGLVFVIEIDGGATLAEEDSFEPGKFVRVDELEGKFESWSQILIDNQVLL